MISKEIDIEKAKCKNTTLKHNLTPEEGKALHKLSKHNDIIISNAGKGGAVVIQDYIKEAEQQLGNKEYYKILVTDSTELHEKLVEDRKIY